MTGRTIWGRLTALVCALALLAAAPRLAARDQSPTVAVSIPPQAWVIQQIAGETVAVQTLLAAGQDPHTFSLTPKTTMELGRASLYLTIGVEFEMALTRKLAGPNGPRLVDMAWGIALPPGMTDSHDDHGHDHAGHDHSGPDRHVWLTPVNLSIMAANAAQALGALQPARRNLYAENLAAFEARMTTLDAELAAALAPYDGQTFYVYHGAFGHLAAAYGLRQEALQIGSRKPSPRELRDLIKNARADGVRLILVQPQFDASAARTLADAIDGQVEPADPMAADVPANLRALAQAMQKAVGK